MARDARCGPQGLIDVPLLRGIARAMAAAEQASSILIWAVLAIGVTIGFVVRVLHRMRD